MTTTSRRSFQLHVFGTVNSVAPLTMFAEYRAMRAVERVLIEGEWVRELSRRVRALRRCIETGEQGYELDELKELGGQLFQLVLRRTVRDLLVKTRDPGEELPFELVAEDPQVLGWPWEFMYDPQGGGQFICR